jgi:hypothetical protein
MILYYVDVCVCVCVCVCMRVCVCVCMRVWRALGWWLLLSPLVSWLYPISHHVFYPSPCHHTQPHLNPTYFGRFHYEFRPEIEADPQKFQFMRMRDRTMEAKSERQEFLGSLQRDVALWFSLGAIATAWLPGGVTHRDVLHAYVVVVMWFMMHHYLRRATCWGIKYVSKSW